MKQGNSNINDSIATFLKKAASASLQGKAITSNQIEENLIELER